MRVLLVNAHGGDLARGGAEKYVCEIAAGLERRGHEATVLSAFPLEHDGFDGETVVLHATDWRGDNRRRIENHLGDLVANPSRRLEAVVAAARPEVAHTNNLAGISTGLWEVCRRLGVPVVHTIHDYHLLCPRVTLQRRDGTPCCPHPAFCRVRTARLVRWTSAVDDVVVVSDYVRRRHEHLFPDARFHLVRIPVTPLGWAPLAPPRSPPQTIGYLGTLDRVKGIEALLEAAAALREAGFVVQVAGAGRLRGLVEEAAARGVVHYAETVHGEAKRRFVEATDLAVLPSTWEEPGAPPYSVAEWLAAGRPILVSRRGGLAELGAQFAGVVTMEAGPEGLVEAARKLADGAAWDELVRSIPLPDDAAAAEWLDRHEALYELARSRSAGVWARSTSAL
jgi:glycosyltransferase involved in cell wall biosynthesis